MKVNNITKIKVRSYELDAFRHVNNAIYLNYLEKARVDLLMDHQMVMEESLKKGMMYMLVRIEINYRKEACFGDELTIEHRLAKRGNKSFTLAFTIHNQRRELVSDGLAVLTIIDKSGKAVPLPPDLVEFLNRMPVA